MAVESSVACRFCELNKDPHLDILNTLSSYEIPIYAERRVSNMRRSALHLCTLAAVVLLCLPTNALADGVQIPCAAAAGSVIDYITGGEEGYIEGGIVHCRDCPPDTHRGEGGMEGTDLGCRQIISDYGCKIEVEGLGNNGQQAVLDEQEPCIFNYHCYWVSHEQCPPGCENYSCENCNVLQIGKGGWQGTADGCVSAFYNAQNCAPGHELVEIQPEYPGYGAIAYFQCYPCFPGKYSRGGTRLGSCARCPAGQQPSADKSSCVPCSVGYYRDPTESTDNGFCKVCDTGLSPGQRLCCEPREGYERSTHTCEQCQQHEEPDSMGCAVCPSNTIYTGLESHFGDQTRTTCEPCGIIDGKQSYRTGDELQCHVCHGATALRLQTAGGTLIDEQHAACFFTRFGDPRPGCSSSISDYEDVMAFDVEIQCHECALGEMVTYAYSGAPAECITCPVGYIRDVTKAECELCPPGYTSSQYDLRPWYPRYENGFWDDGTKNIFFRGYHQGLYTVADYCDFSVNANEFPESDEHYAQECQRQNTPNPQYCVLCRQGFKGVSGMCVECGWKEKSAVDRTTCQSCLPHTMSHGHTIARLQHLHRNGNEALLRTYYNPNSAVGSTTPSQSDVFTDNHAAREVMKDYVWRYYMEGRNDADPGMYLWSDAYQTNGPRWGYLDGVVNNYELAYANIPWEGVGTDPRPSDSIFKHNVIRVCCTDGASCTDAASQACRSEHSSSYEIPVADRTLQFDYDTVMRVYRDQTIADVRDLSGWNIQIDPDNPDEYAQTVSTGIYECTQYVWKGGLTFPIFTHTDPITNPGDISNSFTTVKMTGTKKVPFTERLLEYAIEWCDVLPLYGCECFEGFGMEVSATTCSQCERWMKSDRHTTVCEPCGQNTFNYGRDALNRELYDSLALDFLHKPLNDILIFNEQDDPRFGPKHAFFDRICLTCPVGYKSEAQVDGQTVHNVLPIAGYAAPANPGMCELACSGSTWPSGSGGDRTTCDYNLQANQVIDGVYFARRIVCAAGTQPQISDDTMVDCQAGDDSLSFLTSEFCVQCENCPAGHFKTDAGLGLCSPCGTERSAGPDYAHNTIRFDCRGSNAGLVTCAHGYYGDAESECEECPAGWSRDPAVKPQIVTNYNDCSQCQAPEGRNNANLRCEECDEHYEYSFGGKCINCGKRISNRHPRIATDPLYSSNGDACVRCEDVAPCPAYHSLVGCGDSEHNSDRGEGMGTCVRDECPAGHFWSEQNNQCQQCEQGTYMPETGYQTSCDDCSATQWSGLGATSCKSCANSEQYVNQDGICESCCKENENEFKLRITGVCVIEHSALESASTCAECPLGTYLNSDKSNCLPCPYTEPFTDPSRINFRNIDSCVAKVCSEADFSQDATWTSLTQSDKDNVLAKTLYYTPVDITAYQTSSWISSSSAQTYLEDVHCKVMTPCPDGTGLSGTSATHGGLLDSLCSGCRFGYRSIGDKFPMECVECAQHQHTGPNRNTCVDCPQAPAEAFDTNVYAYVFSPGLTFQQYTDFLEGFGTMHVCLCALGSFWDEATSTCISCGESVGHTFFSVKPKTLQFFVWWDYLYQYFALYPHRRNNPTSFDHNTRHVSWTQQWHDWYTPSADPGWNGCRSCGSNSAMAVHVKWSVDDNICRCDPDHAKVGGQCVLCGANEYVQRDAAVVFQGNYYERTQCKSCSCSGPLQTFTNTCGGETAPDCRCRAGTEVDSDGICHMCPPGQYGDTVDGPCQSCAPGTYNSYHGSTGCTTCPADSYCATGAHEPTKCHPTRESRESSSSISACQCRAGFTPVAGQEECNLEQGACPVDTYSTLSTTCTALCEDPTRAGTADCTLMEHDLLYTANRAINTDIYASCSGACASDYLIEVLHARVQQDNLAHSIDRHEGLIAAANTTHWFYFDRGFSTYWYPDTLYSSEYTHSELIYVDDTGTQHTDVVDLRNMHRRYVEKTSSWDSWSVVIIPAPSFKDMLNTQTQAYVYVSHYTEEEDGTVMRDRRSSGCTDLISQEQIPLTACTSRLRVFVHVQPGAPAVSSCPGSVTPADECTDTHQSGDTNDLLASVCYDEASCGDEVKLRPQDLPDSTYTSAMAGSFTPSDAQDCALHPQSVLIAPLLGGYVDAADAVTNAAHSTLQFGSTAAEHLLYWSNVRKTVLSLQLFDVKGFIVEFGSVNCGGQIQRRVIVDTSSAPASGSCTGTLKMDVTYESSAAASIAMAHIVRVEPSLSAVQLRARAAAFTKVHVGAFSAWNSLVDIQRVCSVCPNNTATEEVLLPCTCSEGYTITKGSTVTCICCTCDAGYYRNEVGQCAPCVPGTYKALQGDELCTACPTDYTSGEGALICTQPSVTLHTYPATSNAVDQPLTRPMVLCDGLREATSRAMSRKTGGLIENECLAIDVCKHRVYRAKEDGNYNKEDLHTSFTANGWSQWHWRGEPRFAFAGRDLEYRTNPPTTDLYNMYNIEYARIPAGVELETCQTNFTHLRSTGVRQCSLQTERTFVGRCEYDSVTDSASLDCVTAVQHNAIYGGIGTDLQAWYDPAPIGTTQLFRYRIAQDHLCPDDGLPQPGQQFASAQAIYPKAVTACAPVQNGHYETAGTCTVTCNSMHTYVESEQGVSSCEHVCSSYVETACALDEIRLSMCEFEGVEALQCARCDAKAGQNFLGVTQDPTGTCTVTDNVKTCSYADTCNYEDCAVGSSNPGTSLYCTNCPVNTFAPAVRSSACTPCVVDNGEYQPSEGQAGCISCLRTPSTPNPCAAGLIFHDIKEDIDAFFEDPVNAALTPWWEKYCEDGHACLPCPPGTHEVRNGDTGTCEPCAKGTFSNNFGQSVCMTCGDGMTTVSTGANDATACVCLEGHGV